MIRRHPPRVPLGQNLLRFLKTEVFLMTRSFLQIPSELQTMQIQRCLFLCCPGPRLHLGLPSRLTTAAPHFARLVLPPTPRQNSSRHASRKSPQLFYSSMTTL